MKFKEESFVYPYAHDTRIRHTHRRIKNRVVGFMVQMEILLNHRWQPVIRYDTRHGFAHRDMVHPDGTEHKTALAVQDYNEALTWAEQELATNWEIYRARYIKEVKHNERK